MIITLDGPAGVGKTTLAREVAEALKIPYLDTGAMFRFLALELGEEALRLAPAELAHKAGAITFALVGSGAQTRLAANNNIIGSEIRTEEVGRLASTLGQRPEFRAVLLQAQRKLGQQTDLVAEGRDMGTVVFPDAPFKFFLQASPEIRATRRWLELQDKNPEVSLESIARAIAQRDEQDSTRATAPLRPAPDAIILDTSHMEIPAALAKILEAVCSGTNPGKGSRS